MNQVTSDFSTACAETAYVKTLGSVRITFTKAVGSVSRALCVVGPACRV